MNNVFDTLFLNTSLESQKTYRMMMENAIDVLIRQYASSDFPYSGKSVAEISEKLTELDMFQDEPKSCIRSDWIEEIGRTILHHSANVNDPLCIAHLHCPPLIPSLVAELFISATNQSMDSWDQSMTASVLEEKVIDWLCDVFQFGDKSDGVFTSGGTQSNLMGLLLARNHYAMKQWHWNIQKQGLPFEAHKMRVICSEAAHFTVKQSMALLGLGEQAVVSIKTDEQQRMDVRLLKQELEELSKKQLHPFAIVATVGTTDFGSIDPLGELRSVAEEHGMWLHADAAYGGGLVLSHMHAQKLQGLDLVDSITIDFHKMFYQPISCGAFLVKKKSHFNYIHLLADYLNPEEDETDDVPNLVTKSLQTTRRFDALKLYMSLQYVGRKTFGDMVDYTLQLAKDTSDMMKVDPNLELVGDPELNAIVFRYMPTRNDLLPTQVNEINVRIRNELLNEGYAVIARTKVRENNCLKVTLLNPRTTITHMKALLEKIKDIGNRLEES